MDTRENVIGQSVRRLEDARFLTGNGRYVDDVNVDGQLWGHVLRSPHAHARILRMDVASARAASGIRAVYTASDLASLGPMPCNANVRPLIIPPRFALAAETVRHVGDPVAFVVADTAEQARDAAELIEVEYETLPAVIGIAGALSGGTQIWTEAPNNTCFRITKGDAEATARAMAGAARIVELSTVNNRVVVAPLEPRAAIATYDAASDTMDLFLTGQGLHGIRRQLAEAVFKLPLEKIQLHAPDVGGGFGMKNFLYPEWILLLWAARALRRPVKWVEERAEQFISATQGRGLEAKAKLGLDRDGKFLAMQIEIVGDMGAYLSGNGPGAAAVAASTAHGGVYDIPLIAVDVRGVFTNTVPVDAYRGAGKPEANYITETIIELAAARLGRQPAVLREQNVIKSYPYRTAMGLTIDSGGFHQNLNTAVVQADLKAFEARRVIARTKGRLRGIGMGCFLETSRGAPNEGAEVQFEASGTVMISTGTESNGQGHETSFTQIAAARLGLPMSAFRFVQADTRQVKAGAGHGGARSMHMAGAALVKAIDEALGKARTAAAQLLQAGEGELDYAQGRFSVRGTGRSVELLSLARESNVPSIGGHVMNITDVFTFPSGCHFAEVEIDPETGGIELVRYLAVDDYGRLINPLLTVGQVEGGVTQGIGQALLEHTVYDPDSGQLLTGSFMDYALPRAADLPAFEVTLIERPTNANPLGVKGSGQAGAIAAPQTIMAAVLDALRPEGVEHLDMPATPERVWRALRLPIQMGRGLK
jgi:carbon-monoxide dehydrogenase large subunit